MKVVYLIGAGASFGLRDTQNPVLSMDYEYLDRSIHSMIKDSCTYPNIIEGLPIVKELPGRMAYIVGKLYEHYPLDRSDKKGLAVRELANNLKWLIEESESHSTIDTFAKKLWLTGREDDYLKLKRTLSAFFMLEQMNNRPDKRYDAFFASVLGQNAIDLPSNIRILSWNYDIQLELAYAAYLQTTSLNDIENALFSYQKSVDVNSYKCGNGFRVIKLNGSALMYDKSNQNIIDPSLIDQSLSSTSIDKVSSIINSDEYECALSFAWESIDDHFKDKIKKNIEDAEALVIIGYSFPYFNRTIDKFLFQSMPGLKKIYLQDKDPDTIEQSVTNLLTTSHTTVNKTKIEKKYHTQQFYLPPEL